MKIAACFSTDSTDCHAAVKEMTQAMQLCAGQQPGSYTVSGGALGYVTSSDRFSSIRLLRKAENGNLLMISGVPIDLRGSLDAKLQDVLAGNFREAAGFLSTLDGAFAVLFWDARNQKLVTVNDALGIQPLYIAKRGDTLLLATELKAFPASGLIDVEMDPAGWGAFVSMGYTIADRTQLSGVKRADPATIMVYDSKAGSFESTVHWSWPEPKPKMQLADVDIAEMLQIMRREIECYSSHHRSGTTLLSGGFDSRLILALLNELNIDCRALVMSHLADNAEAKFAMRIARKLNCRDVQHFVPSWDYFSSPAYLRFLAMNEVATSSMRLYVSPHLSEGIKPEMEAVWEGLGPGFAFAPAHWWPGGFAEYRKIRCKERDSLHWQATFSAFSDPVGQAMYENFAHLLQREMGKYTDDDFGVERFHTSNQMRGFLALSPLMVYANNVLPLTPGLSKDLWDLAGSIPWNITSHMKLYFRLFEQHFPAALSVPVLSGGKLLSNRTFAPELWARGKLNSLGTWCSYHWRRLPRAPVVGPTLDRLGLFSRPESESNEQLDAVIRLIPPDHQDLDADNVRTLQKAKPPYSWTTRLGRRTLFYWQTWRWVMDGRLTTWNAETFLQEELGAQGMEGLTMQLEPHIVPAWPKLAWVAKFPHGADAITVYHGPCVEANEQWCVEGVWAGGFADGDFDRTDLIFGSGIRLRANDVIFVSPGTTVDRLYYLCDRSSWYVANSLPALLALTGQSLREDYPEYAQDASTIVFGLVRYKRTMPTTAGEVHVLYFDNLVFDDAQPTEVRKPDTTGTFETFEEYNSFLMSSARRLADNMNDGQRSSSIQPLTTISSGYDAAATAVIAKHSGCRSAVTFKQATSLWRGSDSGEQIAAVLGLSCSVFNRTSRHYSLEEAVWAATGRSRVMNWTLFEYPEPLCLLFTGCYGDVMWDCAQNCPRGPLAGASLANGGIGEFRLLRGIFHCPIPYWAARHRDELHGISSSEPMVPWTIRDHYDRPIPRRIIEDAGVPRGTFARRKKNTSLDSPFLWPFSPESQMRFRSYLRSRDLKTPGRVKVWLFQWIAKLETLLYVNVTRKLGLPDLMVRRHLARECESLLFLWANEELKQLYLQGLCSLPQAERQELKEIQPTRG